MNEFRPLEKKFLPNDDEIGHASQMTMKYCQVAAVQSQVNIHNCFELRETTGSTGLRFYNYT